MAQFPCVCVLGARQVGKTTLVKQAFPDSPCHDLESPSLSDRIALAPEDFLRQKHRPLILDEIQSVPQLMTALKVVVEEHRDENGRFLLLGSASPRLIKGASETLAGRIGFVDLDPLIVSECTTAQPVLSWSDVWVRGGFPTPASLPDGDERFAWFDAYLRTFVERDLVRAGIEVQAPLMRKLLMMLAHTHTRQWNASQIASSAGVSYHTINRYLHILDSAFLVRVLPPYHANVSKRLTKSSKVMLRDSGLYHFLMNIADLDALENSPYCGMSFEGFAVEQIIRHAHCSTAAPRAWYYRTQAGLEADLLLETPAAKIAVEVKYGTRIDKGVVARLESVVDDTGADSGFIAYGGTDSYDITPRVRVLSVRSPDFPQHIVQHSGR